jgi:hypothetical protein
MRQSLVRKIIELRASRRNFLPQWLFDGEAAWDMLLELYCSKLSGNAVRLDSLTAAATISSSVSSRWLRALQSADLVTVTKNLLDGPEIVTISDKGYRALGSYFDALEPSRLL